MSLIQSPDTEKYLDVEGALAFIKTKYGCAFGRSSIYRAVKSKKIKGYTPFGKLLVKESDLVSYWDSTCTEQ